MFGDMNDRISIIKADGSIVRDELAAICVGSEIIIADVHVPIEVNDRILRKLPNGLVEEFFVVDPQLIFIGPNDPHNHFQVKVRRSSMPVTTSQTIVNNFNGDHNRVNVNSVDNSNNQSSRLELTQALDKLLNQVRELGLDHDALSEIQGDVAVLAEADSRVEARAAYNNLIASLADHVTIAAFMVPYARIIERFISSF